MMPFMGRAPLVGDLGSGRRDVRRSYPSVGPLLLAPKADDAIAAPKNADP
jgi:hypothetical protein